MTKGARKIYALFFIAKTQFCRDFNGYLAFIAITLVNMPTCLKSL